MRILADVHISPRTVDFLRSLTHDVVRVPEVLPADASDEAIVAKALAENRTIVTQDLDFSAIIALSGKAAPSLISLRLSSSRIEYVNSRLQRILPTLESDALLGMIFTVEDERIRRRRIPVQ